MQVLKAVPIIEKQGLLLNDPSADVVEYVRVPVGVALAFQLVDQGHKGLRIAQSMGETRAIWRMTSLPMHHLVYAICRADLDSLARMSAMARSTAC
ncbi:MAG: hypothetical protein J2P36_22605 [Ktedonobacteraceae bacterium]|nr:hypothetical protein [Ktedonobacteraceae bacterium]